MGHSQSGKRQRNTEIPREPNGEGEGEGGGGGSAERDLSKTMF